MTTQYRFVKASGYISKGSIMDVPSNWWDSRIMVSAVVHPIGTNMKIFLSQAVTKVLIRGEHVVKETGTQKVGMGMSNG